MDRETQGISGAIKIIEKIFVLPEPRRQKCKTLYRLAKRSTGNIVELGTWHGNGAITLCLGKAPNQLVFTIDDFKAKKGWAGESYGPDDKAMFHKNCDSAKVYPVLIAKSIEEAIKEWSLPIGLLFWDTGQNSVDAAMKQWEPFIEPGGILALHDTYSNIFKANEYMRKMVSDGKYCQYEVMPGGVHVAVKL